MRKILVVLVLLASSAFAQTVVTGSGTSGAKIVAKISQTAQTSSQGNTTIYTPTVAGTYRISGYVYTSTAGSGGTVLVGFGWNSGGGLLSGASPTASLATASDGKTISWTVHQAAGQAILYYTTVASPAGSPKYGLDIIVEQLQ